MDVDGSGSGSGSGHAPRVPSLPPPCPKSPPPYPDLYGTRRDMARIQILERERSFLEAFGKTLLSFHLDTEIPRWNSSIPFLPSQEELKFVEGLLPASRCCKEYAWFCNSLKSENQHMRSLLEMALFSKFLDKPTWSITLARASRPWRSLTPTSHVYLALLVLSTCVDRAYHASIAHGYVAVLAVRSVSNHHNASAALCQSAANPRTVAHA
ncbi:hypothetical protein Cgig2_010479 [Carnegiea gigantea]|uniref:Uncharacterized protein n=1 Tax=Carnegiea gigantea TaxID=171969 RepID=A0A9Q1KTY0_9CARY|nr:hypothetical protein Cgig2_010479 [Carnegiea gigantea]